jgi:hypothetical protein
VFFVSALVIEPLARYEFVRESIASSPMVLHTCTHLLVTWITDVVGSCEGLSTAIATCSHLDVEVFDVAKDPAA